MKKRGVFYMLVTVVAMLTSCGNMSVGLGNFVFQKIHVDTYHYSGCFTVEKWWDCDSGIEVKTKEVGDMFLAEGMYILLGEGDSCPFCDAGVRRASDATD